MISNERSSHFAQRCFTPYKPPVNENTLESERLQIERKMFVLTLKENPRGRFLRITEDVGRRHDSIIVPSSGSEAFRELLAEMARLSDELSAKRVLSKPTKAF
jgi:predicted ATP-grasp superfamily ATP-dependent carboligase